MSALATASISRCCSRYCCPLKRLNLDDIRSAKGTRQGQGTKGACLYEPVVFVLTCRSLSARAARRLLLPHYHLKRKEQNTTHDPPKGSWGGRKKTRKRAESVFELNLAHGPRCCCLRRPFPKRRRLQGEEGAEVGRTVWEEMMSALDLAIA